MEGEPRRIGGKKGKGSHKRRYARQGGREGKRGYGNTLARKATQPNTVKIALWKHHFFLFHYRQGFQIKKLVPRKKK